MLMLISQQDAEIEENNIFNKILRCVLYFNTKGTATIKPLIAIGEPFTCTNLSSVPLVTGINLGTQLNISNYTYIHDQKVNLRGIRSRFLLFKYSREN